MQNYYADENHQDCKRVIEFTPERNLQNQLIYHVTPVNAFLDEMFLEFQLEIGLML